MWLWNVMNIRLLRASHVRCLRKIIDITWQDHVPRVTIQYKNQQHQYWDIAYQTHSSGVWDMWRAYLKGDSQPLELYWQIHEELQINHRTQSQVHTLHPCQERIQSEDENYSQKWSIQPSTFENPTSKHITARRIELKETALGLECPVGQREGTTNTKETNGREGQLKRWKGLIGEPEPWKERQGYKLNNNIHHCL